MDFLTDATPCDCPALSPPFFEGGRGGCCICFLHSFVVRNSFNLLTTKTRRPRRKKKILETGMRRRGNPLWLPFLFIYVRTARQSLLVARYLCEECNETNRAHPRPSATPASGGQHPASLPTPFVVAHYCHVRWHRHHPLWLPIIVMHVGTDATPCGCPVFIPGMLQNQKIPPPASLCFILVRI